MSFNSAKNFKKAPPPTSQSVAVGSRLPSPIQTLTSADWKISPINDFLARGTWEGPHLLGGAGWQAVRYGVEVYWRRPGKTTGYSAAVNSDDKLVVFSTETPFVVSQAYSKFTAYAALHHNNDWPAASAALHALGYGQRANAVTTHQGNSGYTYSNQAALFLMAVTNFFGQDTFYVEGNKQAEDFIDLCHKVAVTEPMWFMDFVSWLRNDANMRSAALVASLEGVQARLAVGADLQPTKGPGFLRILAGTGVGRADEFGEALAYLASRYGRAIPKPIKRGLADAMVTNLDEFAALKYNSDNDAFKLGDVIRLIHPKPHTLWQADLFKWLVSSRYGDATVPASLGMVSNRKDLMAVPVAQRRGLILSQKGPAILRAAGMTWESLAGWLQGPLDAAAWKAIIPGMGYMALLRNLGNFDRAGIDNATAEWVAARIASTVEVAKSRQLPMRFLSAYRHAPSLRWGLPLSKALDASLLSIPALPGRTLVMVDTSGSMNHPMSDKSKLVRWDAAALFGIALARTSPGVELHSYSSGHLRSGQSAWSPSVLSLMTKRFTVYPGMETLGMLDKWSTQGFNFNGGTPTTDAAAKLYNGHDRVILITDGQPDHNQDPLTSVIPADVPLFVFDIGSYRQSQVPTGPNVHVLGGLTDHMFRVIELIGQGKSADWPWTPSNAVS